MRRPVSGIFAEVNLLKLSSRSSVNGRNRYSRLQRLRSYGHRRPRIDPKYVCAWFNVHGTLLRMRHPRLWLGTGLLLIVAAAALGVIVAVHYPHTRDLIQTLVAVAAVAVPGTAWLWRRAHPAEARLPLEQAADELAEELRRQWERVAAEQGLIVPAPIPVRWRWSPRRVTGSIAEVVGGSGRQSRFAPLPGVTAVTAELVRSGSLHDLYRIYGGLSSGRLIVLGEPGAGKSGAGILLLLEALAQRTKLTAPDRTRVPVPVLVTLQSWDPTAEPLTAWLANRLARDYALLRAPEYGEDGALRLLESGYIAVILDGLDEMPETLRSVALRALNEQATFRLVVLSRGDELAAAVSDAHLRGAAALELMPIDSEQAANYLTSCQIDPLPPRWQHLIDHLREHPDSVLAQALNTPLTLTLVRDTYGQGAGIDEPSDIYNSRIGSVEAIEERLLDQVLTAAYAQHPGRPIPPYTVDQARRWLGKLARWMNEEGTRDLTWWKIPRWVPAWPRAVVTVVVMSLVCAFIVVPLAGLAAGMHLLSAFEVGSLAAFVATAGKSLGFAFMFGPGLLLMSPSRRAPPQGDRPRWSGTDLFVILLAALGVGLGIGLQNGLLQGPKRGLTIGLMVSFVIGLGFVLCGGPPQRLGWLRWSKTDTRTNLRTGLVIGLVAGLVAGLGYGLGYDLKHGLIYGLLVGVAYLLVIVLGGRSSQRLNQPQWTIDVPLVLLIGLVIAITSGAAGYGIAYLLTVILGGRLPLLRSRLRWSRTATPTAILSGLAAGSALGLVFGLTGWLFGRLSAQGLMYGLILGLAFGLLVGLLLGLRQPPTEATNPLDPQSLWRQERRFGLGFGLMAGLVYGLVTGLVFGLEEGILYGLTAGLMIGVGSGLVSSVTWAVVLTSAQLRRRDETPARLLEFLDDARKRQILRMVGSAYQFRHARLQSRLAGTYGTTVGEIADQHNDHIPSPRAPVDDTLQKLRSSDPQAAEEQ